MSDDLVKRLRNTPNWMREEYAHYKDGLKVYDRAPFEAAYALEAQAAEITRLRAELATARREGMEEAAQKADAIACRFRVELPEKWKARPGGIPKDWMDTWEACAETAEEIAAAIRTAAQEVKP